MEKDLASSDSIFRYYQRLCRMRKEHPAVTQGDLRFYGEDKKVLCYTRSCAEERILVIANKSDLPAEWTLPDALQGEKGTLLLSNLSREAFIQEKMHLSPWEVLVFSIK